MRAGVALAALGIVAIVVGTNLLTTRPPAPSDGIAVRSAQPSAGPEDAAWVDLELPPFEPAAELSANDSDRLGVATDTTFTLRSLDGTPAQELAAGLTVDPEVEFDVEAAAAADTAVVRPTEPLVEGRRYRFRLDAPDGSLAGTWAFVTRAPVAIVGTLPGDRAVRVPVNTGIEITFAQDGTSGVSERFAIEPDVPGRFERHDRVWAFIPDRPLDPATIYTVTVRSGVGVEGSNDVLTSDVSFRFETDAASASGPRLEFGRALLEVRPNTAVDVAVDLIGFEDDEGDENRTIPASVTVSVHRLPTFEALVEAATTLAGPAGWAVAAPSAVVPTAGLDLVGELDSPVVETRADRVLQIPAKLSAGSYVLTMRQPGDTTEASAAAQLVLQVTDLSAYVLTASSDAIVWVNDLGGDNAMAGASVALAGGRELGRTDAEGIVRFATPAELLAREGEVRDGFADRYVPPAANLVTVTAADGRRLVVPLGLPVSWVYGEGSGDLSNAPADSWWLLFHTDRAAFRSTDTLNFYGMIRARADRSVPDDLKVHLRASESSPDAPILRQGLDASSRGVFSGSMQLRDVPEGTYRLELYANGIQVANVWFRVTQIRKPAYAIEVTTGRHVYLDGQRIRATAVTRFYDGTVVPGMDLVFSGMDKRLASTTDATGIASVVMQAAFDSEDEGAEPESWSRESIGARPVNPEEGQIEGTGSVLVLPSRFWLAAEGGMDSGQIVAEGRLTWADIAGMEADVEAGRDVDAASGDPIGGRDVRATVIRLIPERKQVGTTYDFIEKRVVPLYEYNVREERIATRTLTSAADGTFRVDVEAPDGDDSYRVRFTATDPEDRTFLRQVFISPPDRGSGESGAPYLGDSRYGCGFTPTERVGLGKPVNLTMHDRDGSQVADGRLLFVIGRGGSLEAVVQDESTLARRLGDADLPGFTVRAVWLARGAYHVADADAMIDLDQKRLTVRLEADEARYRPGDRVTIAVRTTDPDGRGVATDVVIRGVDQKLYTLGFAYDEDPLTDLMAPTSSGFYQAYRSHAVPVENGDGCGDTGGQRDDFRDEVTFQRITTEADGSGSVSFDLPDDLTSWHITATAVSEALDAGTGSVLLPVGLPFFVEAVLAPEYLAGDEAELRLRAYGEGLESGDAVRFVVAAPSLGLAPTVVEGKAFEAVPLALPPMALGDHEVRIEAEGRHGDATLRDVLVRRVSVVSSRLSSLATTYDLISPTFTPRSAPGLTTFTITDAGRGRLLQLLDELASARSARFDRALTADLARTILLDDFAVPATAVPETGFEAGNYHLENGVALLPYGSAELPLTALAALVAPERMDAERLREALHEWADAAATTPGAANRERGIVALAGLSGLGGETLADLGAIDRTALTVGEQLWLALGFAAAGDEPTARQIERQVLDGSGERLGPWVRLAGATPTQALDASALLLLLAGRLGDPVAHDVARYIADNRRDDRVYPLQELGYVEGFLARLPREAARLAWTIDGERRERTLGPGEGFTLVLTSGQSSGLRLEALEGELGVVTSWSDPEVALPSNDAVSLTRVASPSGEATADRLVRVDITVSFAADAPRGCYRLTDVLPSGLAPVTSDTPVYDDEGEIDGIRNHPYAVEGQRVSWCAAPEDESHVYSYVARVVSPGAYLWEPAVIQWELASHIGNTTRSGTYAIR